VPDAQFIFFWGPSASKTRALFVLVLCALFCVPFEIRFAIDNIDVGGVSIGDYQFLGPFNDVSIALSKLCFLEVA